MKTKKTFMALVAILGSLIPALQAAENHNQAIDITRTQLEKWVETRRMISREKRDFKLGREMLKERIDLIHREIDSLEGKISEAEKSISEADKKRVEMMMENEKLKNVSKSLETTVIGLEHRTQALLNRLPAPLVELTKPLAIRLPDDSNDTQFSLSERYMNVIGILNAVNKFNRQISLTSEVRTLPDGTKAEVVVMYVGIGQAYYAGANGSIAGIGFAGKDGWEWKPANEAAAAISDAIAILNNEKVAAFVHLPLSID